MVWCGVDGAMAIVVWCMVVDKGRMGSCEGVQTSLIEVLCGMVCCSSRNDCCVGSLDGGLGDAED